MNCQKCSGDLQGGLVYCPDCLTLVRSSRQQSVGEIREELQRQVEAPQSSERVSKKRVFAFIFVLIGLLVIAALTLLFLKRPALCRTPLEAVLLATSFGALCWVIFAGTMLWVRVLTQNTMWALMSLILPSLMFRYVSIYWAEVRQAVLALIASYVLFFCSLMGYDYTHSRSVESAISTGLMLAICPAASIQGFGMFLDEGILGGSDRNRTYDSSYYDDERD